MEQMEKDQERDRCSLETLVSEAAAVWSDMQSMDTLQNQREHQAQQLLSLIEEGHKLLLPSKELSQ